MKMKSVLLLSVLSLFLLVNTGLAAAAPLATGKEASITSINTNNMDAISLTATGTTSLVRGPITIDWAKTSLIVKEGNPTLAYVNLVGYLPDPCHKLGFSTNVSKTTGTIYVSAYSLYDPSIECITIVQPFSVMIPLGSFTSGTYMVVVNGVKIGSFSVSNTISASG